MRINVSFNGLRITRDPKYYSDSSTVEIMAADIDDKSKYPCEFKLVYRGWDALRFFKVFKKGDVISGQGGLEAYKAEVYGCRQKPLHNTNGKGVRKTDKNRIAVSSMVPTTIYHEKR